MTDNPGKNEEEEERFRRMGLEEGDFYLSPEGYIVFTEQYLSLIHI